MVNGTNLIFKTFEFRRVTNLKTQVGPSLGVFVDGVRLSEVTGITSDDPAVGEVILTAAPLDGSVVEATYYSQWFLDAELDAFLRSATEWLQLGSDPTNIPGGLQPAAKYYAAQEAYHKLCSRWAEMQSETFRFEDSPSGETKTPVDYYRALANDARIKSEKLRNDYYSRSGQQLAPLFASIPGAVPRVQPKR
jgi:hypothetical protein